MENESFYNFRNAFRDFDGEIPVAQLEARGFYDTSWHNDAMPSFTYFAKDGETEILKIWFNYNDEEMREHGCEHVRNYSIYKYENGECVAPPIYECDHYIDFCLWLDTFAMPSREPVNEFRREYDIAPWAFDDDRN